MASDFVSADQQQAVLGAISVTLQRRGFLTTEWWTTVLAGVLSAALALVGVHGQAAAQVVGVLAPVLVAGMYAAVRTMHKSALARVLSGAFPSASASASASAVPVSAELTTKQ